MEVVKFALKAAVIGGFGAIAIVAIFPDSTPARGIVSAWDRFVARGGDETIVTGALLIALLWGAIWVINKLPGGGGARPH